MFKKILVAYDGSESSDRAFDAALELAQPFAADLTVLSVARPPEPPTMVETEAVLESATEHFEDHFQRLRDRARTTGREIVTAVAVGHPAEQIIHAAGEQHADVIVMGHRGKSRIEKWLLGSISKQVLSYAPCKVLIVR